MARWERGELRALATEAFSWLTEEFGYALVDWRASDVDEIRLLYESARTRVWIHASVLWSGRLVISLAPAGGGFCSLDACLGAHGQPLARLDRLAGEAPEVKRQLQAASTALRRLMDWEVGGNWSLV